MKAAVMHATGEPLSIEEVPTPKPGPGQVLVKIAGAGVCHSDLHQVNGSIPPPRLPIVLGHENAGWVEKLGAGTRGFAVGDPVAVFGGWGCGQCRYCLGGAEQLCDRERWCGVGADGGYAEYLLVPAPRHLVPVPGLDLTEVAALTDAGLTSYRAVKRVLPILVPGTTVLLIGAGGLGQYGLQLLRILSSARVVVVETSVQKRELAAQLGADVVIDGALPDAVERVRAETAGEGVHAALDFVGVDATLSLARESLARTGTIVLVGLAGGTTPFSFLGLAPEAQMTNVTWGSRNDLAELIALAATGRVHVNIERLPLDAVNKALQRLESGAVLGRAVLVP